MSVTAAAACEQKVKKNMLLVVFWEILKCAEHIIFGWSHLISPIECDKYHPLPTITLANAPHQSQTLFPRVLKQHSCLPTVINIA